jgi:soluble lytic murein transglycosylase-like protein
MTQPVSSTIPLTPADHAKAHDAKIRKASRDLEGVFISHLIKVMRAAARSIDGNDMPGKDVMGDYADMELGRVLAERQGIGISDILYKSLRAATETFDDATMATQRADVPARTPSQKQLKLLEIGNRPYDIHVHRAARRYDLSPNLIRSVIDVESGGNAFAVSPKNAKGLMQLTDSTAGMLGVRDVWDPKENIDGGSRYLRYLLDYFDGDLRLALAAYNAGPAAVDRYGGVPPYPETQDYVDRVLHHYRVRYGGHDDNE